jgi:hypothetical protein
MTVSIAGRPRGLLDPTTTIAVTEGTCPVTAPTGDAIARKFDVARAEEYE